MTTTANNLNVTVTVKQGDKAIASYQLTQTAAATKNAKGKISLAHFQASADNLVIKSFGKLYIDTTEVNKLNK